MTTPKAIIYFGFPFTSAHEEVIANWKKERDDKYYGEKMENYGFENVYDAHCTKLGYYGIKISEFVVHGHHELETIQNLTKKFVSNKEKQQEFINSMKEQLEPELLSESEPCSIRILFYLD